MTSVAIIDYGMGNLDSVARAVELSGGAPRLADSPNGLAGVERVILPGVGAYADGMQELKARGLDAALKTAVEEGTPLLGICLGMQLLATRGFEGGETAGLGLIPGEVRRFAPETPATRVPHVGWNEVRASRPCPLFDGVPDGSDFYFVHSFHFVPEAAADAAAATGYCGGFVSCVHRANVFGVQFHPEKSQRLGLKVLKNFTGVDGARC